MASLGILSLFTFIFIRIGNAGFISVDCRAVNVGQYGQQSLLECVVKPKQDIEDVEIQFVSWKKEGNETPLLFFHNNTQPKPGYSFAEPSWNGANMNVSLLIINTSVEDEGYYTCEVSTDRGDETKLTSLKVTAKYNKPVVEFDPLTSTLSCDSDGGYPEGQLRWFDEHNSEWTKSSQMKANLTKSGLFHISSKLTLLERSTFSNYTCMVFNASGGKEGESTYKVPDQKSEEHGQLKGLDPSTKIVAPLVVIGSLIAGLLFTLLIYRRRTQLARRYSTAPLVDGHDRVRTSEPGGEEGDHQEIDSSCQDSLA